MTIERIMFERRRFAAHRAALLLLAVTVARGVAAQPADFRNEPSTGPEAAEPDPATEENTADALFRSGREALQRGDYAEACANFAESDRIEPSPGAKLNRALCETQRGQLALAFHLLQSAIATLPPDDERLLIAQRHADELRGRLAFLTLTLRPRTNAAARVVSDGMQLTSAELGVPLAFDVGAHVLEVTATGYKPEVIHITLAAGESRALLLSVGPPIATPNADRGHTASRSEGTPWRTVGFGLAGAAAALTVSCIVTGALAYDAKQDMARACDAQSACSEEGLSAAARGESYAAISTASLVGALVSGGLGTVLLLTQKTAPKQSALSARGLRWEF